jgi:hypothetical protein
MKTKRKAIELPPEPESAEPEHPREEKVRTLRQCACELFIEHGGTAETFEQLGAAEKEAWAGRVQR